jgi:hypothetical protein
LRNKVMDGDGLLRRRMSPGRIAPGEQFTPFIEN